LLLKKTLVIVKKKTLVKKKIHYLIKTNNNNKKKNIKTNIQSRNAQADRTSNANFMLTSEPIRTSTFSNPQPIGTSEVSRHFSEVKLFG